MRVPLSGLTKRWSTFLYYSVICFVRFYKLASFSVQNLMFNSFHYCRGDFQPREDGLG
jgi:hypothetical protein